jgi:rhodanese-related sulfurtransferase
MSISFDSPGVDIYEFDIQEPSPFALNKEESNPDYTCEFEPEQFITHEFEPEQKQVFIKDIENDCNYVDDVNGDEIDDVNIDEIDDVNGNEIDDIDGNEIDNVNASKPKQNIQFDPPQPSYSTLLITGRQYIKAGLILQNQGYVAAANLSVM